MQRYLMGDDKKIILEIDDETKESTKKCEKSFRCMVDGTHKLCRVTEFIRDNVLFIECLDESFCRYKMSFGNSYICNCPTRLEIYKKYKM